ncbi:hypothetical protein LCGC14_0902310 [marine sediment metagenome]|uniref:Uncharacterized protein n=1 Tax=marine sediment metagenome TaxID=412755 RepID=A0A0F9RF54_9ZZZZ
MTLKILFGIGILIALYDIVTTWRKHTLKYASKKLVNEYRILPLLIWSLCTLLVGIVILGQVGTILKDTTLIYIEYPLVYSIILLSLLITVFWVVCKPLFHLNKPIIKYSEEELEWKKEEKEKTLKFLRKITPEFIAKRIK